MSIAASSDDAKSELKIGDISVLEFHGRGPQWGVETEQLNATILLWEKGHGLEAHINQELDVVLVVLEGEGEAFVEDETIRLRAGMVLPIAKGLVRAITATSERLTYASIHRRRPGLMPTFGKK
jgi:quercetin dioxygenase-like cupin family protein